ncbi:MAG TPA: DUF2156 domain-containing protein [Candidatus Omnitrophota bacterium]|mgnify:CR=1 FL=1|nr:DUF2156 domain-containing protein [Candidatus Omnitrophota bacterium]
MTLLEENIETPFVDRRSQAERLILKYGRNSFSSQILNSGITLWVSRDGEAAAGYVLYGNMRIVGGVPVTNPINLKHAAAEFEEDAKNQGQRVCYFGAEDWLKEIFQNESSHRTVLLGAQPAWNPQLWHEVLSAKPSVRETIRYSVRQGVEIDETAPAAVQNLPEYKACLKEWVEKRKLPKLRFLLNPDILENIGERRFFSARKNGRLIGFLSLVPVAGRNGWLIEHLFRSSRAVKGMNEHLIDTVMQTIQREGSTHATLGLAPLSQRAGFSYAMNPAWVRMIFKWLYSGGMSLYNFNGLDAFKSKFKPHRWEPVYAIVNKPRFSPVTLYRIMGAFCQTSPVLFGLTTILRSLFDLMD